MPQLTLRGAWLRMVDFRDAKEGQLFTRIHLTADYKGTAQDERGWPEFPDGVANPMKLEEEIASSSIELIPNDKELTGQAISLACDQVEDFEVHRVKADKDGTTTLELRFVARTSVIGATGTLETYKRCVGKKLALCHLNYNEQTTIEPTVPATAQMALVDAEYSEVAEPDDNPIVFDDEGNKMLTGPAAERVIAMDPSAGRKESASLAPAAMAGGTHQAKKRPRATAEGAVSKAYVGKFPPGASDEVN